ncbi:MAG: peptidylprolyl isomerase [Planctomycetota bacterium]|jgi:hypothetical protein
MRNIPVWLLLVFCAGCSKDDERTPTDRAAPNERPQPPRVEGTPKVMVEWIEICFEGVEYRPHIVRPREEARKLAYRLLDRARSGVDFQLLKREFSDDRSKRTGEANGPYILCNRGVPHRLRRDGIPELPYDKTSINLRNLAFTLEVNEVGISDYDPKKAPWGWHVVKRIK